MKWKDYAARGAARASACCSLARSLWRVVRNVLFFSLDNEVLRPDVGVSVSIERGKVSVASGSRIFSHLSLRRVMVYPFDEERWPEPQAVAVAVRSAMHEQKMASRDISLVVPGSWVITRTVELPAAAMENLSGAISYELDRLTPLTPDEALWDFTVLEKGQGKIKISLAACRTAIVEPYLKALEDVGVRVARLGGSLPAIATCHRFLTGEDDLVSVELDDHGYGAGLIVEGRMVASTSERFEGCDRETNVARLAEGISRLASAAPPGSRPTGAILSTDGRGWDAAALQALGPSGRLAADLAPGRLPSSWGRMKRSFAASGSVLQHLCSGAFEHNLLGKGRDRAERRPLALTILLVTALAGVSALYAVAPLWVQQRRLEDIGRQLAVVKPQARKIEAVKKEVEALEKELATIESFKRDRQMSLAVLKEITARLPRSAWLTRARIAENVVELEGYAASATEIVPKLEASQLLGKVEFVSPTFRDTRLSADRFVIKADGGGKKKP